MFIGACAQINVCDNVFVCVSGFEMRKSYAVLRNTFYWTQCAGLSFNATLCDIIWLKQRSSIHRLWFLIVINKTYAIAVN